MAALVGLPYLALAYAVGLAVLDPAKGGEHVQLFLPLFAFFSYWALAVVFNMRTAIVTPKGMTLTLLPFPIGTGQKVQRARIALCYVRHIVEYEDGVEIENFYTAGVETNEGQQIDVFIPLDTENEANHAAYQIGAVLNAGPAERPIPVHTVMRTSHDATFVRQAIVWSILLLFAVAAGVVWDSMSSTRGF